MVPVVLAIVLTSFLTLRMVLGNARERNMTVVQEVNSNIGMSLSAILQQNSQFANNPYMLLSLRRILMDSDNIRYADSINLRSLNASLQSIQVTFPYIDNVRLYLDGIDFCYKSNQTIEKVNKEAAWYKGYRRMDQSQAAMAERLPETAGQTGEKLVLYQRLPYYHGAVIMTVNLDRFKEQLRRSIEIDETQSIVFINSRGEELFVWGRGDKNLESAGTFPETMQEEAGRWVNEGGKYYLTCVVKNEDYNLMIRSYIPFEYVLQVQKSYVPMMLMMIIAVVLAVLLISYITTKRNFRNIEAVIKVLADAENGIYPAENNNTHTDDEYGLILGNIIRLYLNNEKLEGELLEKHHAQEVAALTALQAQINPHFLFNTLQIIGFEAEKAGGRKNQITRMTSNLADILKYALADATTPIALKDEIAYLKKYIEIQKYRFGERFIIYYEVEEGLEELPVFRLMLQPLIENSISHGIRDCERNGYIKLTVFRRISNHNILFRVMDTGSGMSAVQIEKIRKDMQTFNVRNIGLANVNNRLKLYFGEEAGLKIISIRGQGTIVSFEISEVQMKRYAEQHPQQTN